MTYLFYDFNNQKIDLLENQNPLVKFFTDGTSAFTIHANKPKSLKQLQYLIQIGSSVRLDDDSVFSFQGGSGTSSGGGSTPLPGNTNLAGAGKVVESGYPSDLSVINNASLDKNLIFIVAGQSNSFGSQTQGAISRANKDVYGFETDNAYVFDRESEKIVGLNIKNDVGLDNKPNGTFSHFFYLMYLEAKKREPYGSKVFGIFTGRDGAGWVGQHAANRQSNPFLIFVDRWDRAKNDRNFGKYFTDEAVKNSKVILLFQGHEADTNLGVTTGIASDGQISFDPDDGADRDLTKPVIPAVNQIGFLASYVAQVRDYLGETNDWKIPFLDFEAVYRYSANHYNKQVWFDMAGARVDENYKWADERDPATEDLVDTTTIQDIKANIPNAAFIGSRNVYSNANNLDFIHFDTQEATQFAPQIAGQLFSVIDEQDINVYKAPVGASKIVSLQDKDASLESSVFDDIVSTNGTAVLATQAQNWENDAKTNIFNFKNLWRYRSTDGYLYFDIEALHTDGSRTLTATIRQKLDPNMFSITTEMSADWERVRNNPRYKELHDSVEIISLVDSGNQITKDNVQWEQIRMANFLSNTLQVYLLSEGITTTDNFGIFLQPSLNLVTQGIRTARSLEPRAFFSSQRLTLRIRRDN